MIKAGSKRQLLAEIARQPQQADPRVMRRKRFKYRPSLVATAIVDIEHMGIEIQRRKHRRQPLVHGWQRKIGRAPSELQSLMRISYAVFCLKKTKQQNNKKITK